MDMSRCGDLWMCRCGEICTGCPIKTMPLLTCINFYVLPSTGMHVTYTIQEITILQESGN